MGARKKHQWDRYKQLNVTDRPTTLISLQMEQALGRRIKGECKNDYLREARLTAVEKEAQIRNSSASFSEPERTYPKSFTVKKKEAE